MEKHLVTLMLLHRVCMHGFFPLAPGLQDPFSGGQSHYWDCVGIFQISSDLPCSQTITSGVSEQTLLQKGGLVSELTLKNLEV